MEENVHILFGLVSGAAAWLLFSPIAGFAVLFGQLFPDLDDITQKRFQSAWITHTAVGPSLAVLMSKAFPVYSAVLSEFVPWFSLGIVLHITLDFIYYEQTLKKAKRPSSVFGKLPDALSLAVLFLPHIPFLLWPWIRV